jgi:8-oxo-dGTP pyrophosphatase MutT (NUDIX family)
LIEALQREILEETNQEIEKISYVEPVSADKNIIHLYRTETTPNRDLAVDDEGVEHACRISINEFIENLHQYDVVGRDKLIAILEKTQ